MIELPDYLKPLEIAVPPFPHQAVTEAVRRREETVPYLLEALKWTAENAETVPSDFMLHEFALHLLAQFREPRGLVPTVRIARHPLVEDLLGDTITHEFGGILASVSGGVAHPIHGLIEDDNADEFARGAGLTALGAMFRAGMLSRHDLSAYLDTLFRRQLHREPMHVWDALVGVCTDLGLSEHLDVIRTAYHEGLADPGYEPLDSVEHRLREGEVTEGELAMFRLIDDTAAEMSNWGCFDDSWFDDPPEESRPSERVTEIPHIPVTTVAAQPTVRSGPKIGRNDPCPCGSGKKYKKCYG